MSKVETWMKLPSLETSQITHMITIPLAHALLGESAYQDEDGCFLKIEVKLFIDALMVQTWQRYRKGVSREVKHLERDEKALEEEWTCEWHIRLIKHSVVPTVIVLSSHHTGRHHPRCQDAQRISQSAPKGSYRPWPLPGPYQPEGNGEAAKDTGGHAGSSTE